MKLKNIFFASILASSAVLSTAQAKSSSQERANEKLVVTFYQQLFGDKNLEAIDKYLAEDYIQHNPTVPDGRAPLKAAVSQWFSGTAKEKVDIVHSAVKGDIVFLHVRNARPDGGINAVVDIFRVHKGKVVEHWDVIQDAPATSANAHPMF